MRWVFSFVFLSGVLFAQANPQISYSVSPIKVDGAPALHVEIHFKGDPDGKTTISLSAEWQGETGLERGILNLQIDSPGAAFQQTSATERIVSHRPNAQLALSYDLVESQARNTDDPYPGYRPVLEPEFFHFVGTGGWITPKWPPGTRAAIQINWAGFPEDWNIANSFGSSEKHQQFEASLAELRNAVFAGGSFRLLPVKNGAEAVVLAIHGEWSFSDDQLSADLLRILMAERDFWRDHNFPYFLVVLTVMPQPGGEGTYVAGTGLTHSLTAFASSNASLLRIEYLFAHELFHTWNSAKLGVLPKPAASFYWFSEGFTEFYSNELLRRQRLISAQDSANFYNEKLRSYFLSPTRNLSNAQVAEKFFTDASAEELPYQRGFLLASRWNSEILRKTRGQHSLDDAMRTLYLSARQGFGSQLSMLRVDNAVRPLLGTSVLSDLERYIDRGELISPESDALGSCAYLQTVPVHSFDLGFDANAFFGENTIQRIIAQSAAYAAGLRDGQKVIARSQVKMGDADTPIQVTVRDANGERDLKFIPQSTSAVEVPEFVLKTGCTD